MAPTVEGQHQLRAGEHPRPPLRGGATDISSCTRVRRTASGTGRRAHRPRAPRRRHRQGSSLREFVGHGHRRRDGLRPPRPRRFALRLRPAEVDPVYFERTTIGAGGHGGRPARLPAAPFGHARTAGGIGTGHQEPPVPRRDTTHGQGLALSTMRFQTRSWGSRTRQARTTAVRGRTSPCRWSAPQGRSIRRSTRHLHLGAEGAAATGGGESINRRAPKQRHPPSRTRRWRHRWQRRQRRKQPPSRTAPRRPARRGAAVSVRQAGDSGPADDEPGIRRSAPPLHVR